MRQTVNVIIHTIWPRLQVEGGAGDKVFMELIFRMRGMEWNWHALSWKWKWELPNEKENAPLEKVPEGRTIFSGPLNS